MPLTGRRYVKYRIFGNYRIIVQQFKTMKQTSGQHAKASGPNLTCHLCLCSSAQELRMMITILNGGERNQNNLL